MGLIDNHNRAIDYARIALIDKCNLRCSYCMPENGLDWLKQRDLLSFDEVSRLLLCLKALDFKKIRFTGGEPFLRKDIAEILLRAREIFEDEEIHLTTNGTLLHLHKQLLQTVQPAGINFSIDSLNEMRFEQISKRSGFKQVYENLLWLIQNGFNVKINAVIMKGINEEDLIELANFTKRHSVDVRFIEEMPFNGSKLNETIHYKELYSRLVTAFPSIKPISVSKNATSQNYSIDNHLGKVGIIAAYSRTFCGTCNRLRITPNGLIKTCLYHESQLSLRDVLRKTKDDHDVMNFIRSAVAHRFFDGFEAEKNRKPVHESMATIGG